VAGLEAVFSAIGLGTEDYDVIVTRITDKEGLTLWVKIRLKSSDVDLLVDVEGSLPITLHGSWPTPIHSEEL
jgi:hypothetical protein